MTRLKRFLFKLNRPLRAIEYVIPITIIASTIVSVSESFLGAEEELIGFLPALIEEFEVVSVVFVVLSVVAAVHLFSLLALDGLKALKIRQQALFVYVVGLSFVGFLSISFQGFLALLWVNMLALSTVSTILYFNIRMIINEYQR